jgi:hypothetical protein
MKIAQHWPVLTSYNNLSTYATVKGGRIPTEPELRMFNDKFHSGYEGGANVGFRNWHPVPYVHHSVCRSMSGLTIVIGRQRAGSVVAGKGAMVGCGSGRRLYSISMTGSSRRRYIPGKSYYLFQCDETNDSSVILWISLMTPIKSWYVFVY